MGEGGDCLGSGESGEAVGVEMGVSGDGIEGAFDVWAFEEMEKMCDGDLVSGGDFEEREVATEVVVEDGIAVRGRRMSRKNPPPGPLPRGAGGGGKALAHARV